MAVAPEIPLSRPSVFPLQCKSFFQGTYFHRSASDCSSPFVSLLLCCLCLYWCFRQGSNLRRMDFQSIALPSELQKHITRRILTLISLGNLSIPWLFKISLFTVCAFFVSKSTTPIIADYNEFTRYKYLIAFAIITLSPLASDDPVATRS